MYNMYNFLIQFLFFQNTNTCKYAKRSSFLTASLCFLVYVYPSCLESLVKIKIEIERRLQCINVYDDDCT